MRPRWSSIPDSNRPKQLGRLLCYHYTNAAYYRRESQPAGRLSELSCVADFRIATVFTLRRSRSFPAVSQLKKKGGNSPRLPEGRVEGQAGFEPAASGCAAGAHPHVLPTHVGARTTAPYSVVTVRRKMVKGKTDSDGMPLITPTAQRVRSFPDGIDFRPNSPRGVTSRSRQRTVLFWQCRCHTLFSLPLRRVWKE